MSKGKKQYVCNVCGSSSLKWSGRCNECKEWGSVFEDIQIEADIIAENGNVLELHVLDKNIKQDIRQKTSILELNRVLGGGIVSGSAILIGGDPGIGKSTLLLQLAARLSEDKVPCLYVTGEESISQIKMRGMRLNLTNSPVRLLAATNLSDIMSTIDSMEDKPSVVIIDSIQTIYSDSISSSPGTVSQVKYVSHQLILYGKKHDITFFLVGHVTKDGQIAGPKILEHMVDTVLYFEGDNNFQFRILRAVKNRFGAVNEIGVFEMRGEGLVEVSNPSEFFLMDRNSDISGISVFAGIEGSRPVLVEVQALVSKSFMPTPRRSVVGWDSNRLSLILAVLAVRYGINLSAHEVYLSIVGGIKIVDPSADLAVAASIISATIGKALPKNSVFFGEVGLSGEVRKVNQFESRVNESVKLGFERVFCSPNANHGQKNLTEIKHIKQLKTIFNY
jgi:DNA repair protein RadA/Sms